MAPNASWLMGDGKVLGWDGERAEIPLYPNCDLVFTLDPKDATSGAMSSWPAGTASTLYFYQGDPVRSGTQLLTAAGIVEPGNIDYIIQSATLDPIRNTVTHFLLTVSMPESPTQEYALYFGKVVKREVS